MIKNHSKIRNNAIRNVSPKGKKSVKSKRRSK